MRRTRFRSALVMLVLAAAAACGGGRADEEQESAGFRLPGEEPYVSPEDSAEAAEAVQAHADAIRDSLRRASGADEDVSSPAPAGPGSSPQAPYRGCMAQAAQAEGADRARLERACENLRSQPPAEASP
jgi:hypothetical protein